MRSTLRSPMLTTLITAGAFLIAAEVSATTIAVTTTEDELNADGDCSLREAVEAANLDAAVDACPAGSFIDVVDVPAGTFTLGRSGPGEDQNQTGDLDFTDTSYPIQLRGAGQNETILEAPQNFFDRVIDVHPDARVFISNLTVQKGNLQEVQPDPKGGCIRTLGEVSVSSSLVQNCLVLGSTTSGSGGAIAVDGAGALTLTRAFVRYSNVSSGTVGSGGAIYAGPGGTSFTCQGSTISSNSARGNTSSLGGGVATEGTTNIENCTITDNEALDGGQQGGGIWFGPSANASVSATTIADNSAFDGGGVYSSDTADDTGPLFTTTIIANNVAGGSGPDSLNRIQSRGYLLIGDTTGAVLDTVGNGNVDSGNLLDVPPQLGQLKDNGGDTPTMELLSDSVARDAGACRNVAGDPVLTDQRRVRRPQFGACDIGAFELGPGHGTTLVAVSTEPPGAACAVGGQRIDVGFDNGAGFSNPGDNILDPGEIMSTSFVCNGLSTLSAATAEPPGANCAAGGERLDFGADDGDPGGVAANGALESAEVDDTFYVCNGVQTLVETSVEPAGANCIVGGERIRVGTDDGAGAGIPANGMLEPGEVLQEIFVCDLPEVLVVTTTLAIGDPNCAYGGAQIDIGVDDGDGGGTPADGILQAGEIDSTEYVCNGSGAAQTLVVTTALPVGDADCSAGGVRIDVGLDDGDGQGTEGDGDLHPDEIDETTLICNGATGQDGANGEPGVDGANGADGGAGEMGATGAAGPEGSCSIGSPLRRSPGSTLLWVLLGAALAVARRGRRK